MIFFIFSLFANAIIFGDSCTDNYNNNVDCGNDNSCIWNFGKCVEKYFVQSCDMLEVANCNTVANSHEYGGDIYCVADGTSCKEKQCTDFSSADDIWHENACLNDRSCTWIIPTDGSYLDKCKDTADVSCEDFFDETQCLAMLGCSWLFPADGGVAGTCTSRKPVCGDFLFSNQCDETGNCVFSTAGCVEISTITSCTSVLEFNGCFKVPPILSCDWIGSCVLDSSNPCGGILTPELCAVKAESIGENCFWRLDEEGDDRDCALVEECWQYINKDQCNSDITFDYDDSTGGHPLGCVFADGYCYQYDYLNDELCFDIDDQEKCAGICSWSASEGGSCTNGHSCPDFDLQETDCWNQPNCQYVQVADTCVAVSTTHCSDFHGDENNCILTTDENLYNCEFWNGKCLSISEVECADYSGETQCNSNQDKHYTSCVYVEPWSPGGPLPAVCKARADKCEFAVSEDECSAVTDYSSPISAKCAWDSLTNKCVYRPCSDLNSQSSCLGTGICEFIWDFAASTGVCVPLSDPVCSDYLNEVQCNNYYMILGCQWLWTAADETSGVCRVAPGPEAVQCSEFQTFDDCMDLSHSQCLYAYKQAVGDGLDECVPVGSMDCRWNEDYSWTCTDSWSNSRLNCMLDTNGICIDSTCAGAVGAVACASAGPDCKWFDDEDGSGGSCVTSLYGYCTEYMNPTQCDSDANCIFIIDTYDNTAKCVGVVTVECKMLVSSSTCTGFVAVDGECEWYPVAAGTPGATWVDVRFGGHCGVGCTQFASNEWDCRANGCKYSGGTCTPSPAPLVCGDFNIAAVCDVAYDALGNPCVFEGVCKQRSTTCGGSTSLKECAIVSDPSSPWFWSSTASSCVWSTSEFLCRPRKCSDNTVDSCDWDLCYPNYDTGICEDYTRTACDIDSSQECQRIILPDGRKCIYDRFECQPPAATCAAGDYFDCASIPGCYWDATACQSIPTTCASRPASVCAYKGECYYEAGRTPACKPVSSDCTDYTQDRTCLESSPAASRCFWNQTSLSGDDCQSYDGRTACDIHIAEECARITLADGSKCHFDLATSKCKNIVATTCAGADFYSCVNIGGCYWEANTCKSIPADCSSRPQSVCTVGGTCYFATTPTVACVPITSTCAAYTAEKYCRTIPKDAEEEPLCVWIKDASVKCQSYERTACDIDTPLDCDRIILPVGKCYYAATPTPTCKAVTSTCSDYTAEEYCESIPKDEEGNPLCLWIQDAGVKCQSYERTACDIDTPEDCDRIILPDGKCYFSTTCKLATTNCADYTEQTLCETVPLSAGGNPLCFYASGVCQSYSRSACDVNDPLICPLIILPTGQCFYDADNTCKTVSCLPSQYWDGSACVTITNNCGDYSTLTSCSTYPKTAAGDPKCYWDQEAITNQCKQRSSPCVATNKYDCQSTGLCAYVGTSCTHLACNTYSDMAVCKNVGCDAFAGAALLCKNYVDPAVVGNCSEQLGEVGCAVGDCVWNATTGCVAKKDSSPPAKSNVGLIVGIVVPVVVVVLASVCVATLLFVLYKKKKGCFSQKVEDSEDSKPTEMQ